MGYRYSTNGLFISSALSPVRDARVCVKCLFSDATILFYQWITRYLQNGTACEYHMEYCATYLGYSEKGVTWNEQGCGTYCGQVRFKNIDFWTGRNGSFSTFWYLSTFNLNLSDTFRISYRNMIQTEIYSRTWESKGGQNVVNTFDLPIFYCSGRRMFQAKSITGDRIG